MLDAAVTHKPPSPDNWLPVYVFCFLFCIHAATHVVLDAAVSTSLKRKVRGRILAAERQVALVNRTLLEQVGDCYGRGSSSWCRR